MRLSCPSCNAEYEAPDHMIPGSGRHVQCSACHTRWFASSRIQPQLSEDQIIARLESRAATPRRPGPVLVRDASAEPGPAAVAPDYVARITEPEAREDSPGKPEPSAETPETKTEASQPAPDDFTWEEPESGDAPSETEAAQVPGDQEQKKALSPASETAGNDAVEDDEDENKNSKYSRTKSTDSDAREATENLPEEHIIWPPPLSDNADEFAPDPDIRDATHRLDVTGTETSQPAPVSPQPGFRSGLITAAGIAVFLLVIYLGSDVIAQAIPPLSGPVSSLADLIDGIRGAIATRFPADAG